MLWYFSAFLSLRCNCIPKLMTTEMTESEKQAKLNKNGTQNNKRSKTGQTWKLKRLIFLALCISEKLKCKNLRRLPDS